MKHTVPILKLVFPENEDNRLLSPCSCASQMNDTGEIKRWIPSPSACFAMSPTCKPCKDSRAVGDKYADVAAKGRGPLVEHHYYGLLPRAKRTAPLESINPIMTR